LITEKNTIVKNREKQNRLVYSTAGGGVPSEKKAGSLRSTARIQRETKGHQGKTVTLISGLALRESELQTLAAELKKACGCGGSVKDGIILIQGDKRDILVRLLTARGYQTKIAGG